MKLYQIRNLILREYNRFKAYCHVLNSCFINSINQTELPSRIRYVDLY